jgi:hypothetical protein
MSESELADVERTLGHRVEPARRGTIRDLYDVPPDLLADARRLRSLTLSHQLLRYHTASTLWRWLPEFIDDVVERGVEPQEWRRGGILFPLFRVKTLVTLGVGQVLSVLEPRDDEAWLQVAPERDQWEIREAVTGAPAVHRPLLRYDWDPPEHVRRVTMNGLERLLAVDDVVVATRRWMASRIAREASDAGGIERFADPGALFAAAFPGVPDVSDDAVIAARGALREAGALGPSDAEVPGFRGPADWYR